MVLACDNALPHLLYGRRAAAAAQNMWQKTRSGGLLLASIRDYDEILRQRPRSELRRVFGEPGDRRIVFQVWDWENDGSTYTVHLFVVRESRGGWNTAHRVSWYRALRRDELSAILCEAGFADVRWLMP